MEREHESGDPQRTIEEATGGQPSQHERRVVEERDEEREADQGSWPGQPGEPPGAARTDDR
jgi:hypothetical protein